MHDSAMEGVSRLAGCHVASLHAAASHLPAPFIATIAFCASRLPVWLVVPSHRFSRRHLSSAGASASHRAVASSCHTHLGPLVPLVKASPLLTLPPPICGIIESSQRSGLMLV